jgi:hypothetical protein
MKSIQDRNILISKIPSFLLRAIVAAGAFVVLLTLMSSAAAQNQQQTFVAKLSGSNEVPPVTSTATGMAQFQISPDANKLHSKCYKHK